MMVRIALPQKEQIVAALQEVAAKYPANLVATQQRDVQRIAFHVQCAIDVAPAKALSEISICDIGGGIGLFSVGCAALGFGRVVLVDDFADEINRTAGMGALQLHESYGVEISSRDIVSAGMDGLPEQLDVITSFDSMEHWHHSPKALFREVYDRLRPGGGFVLGVPNNVNLRKRISVPFGYGQWSSMQDWYESSHFRGHVREPNVRDLHYIARDMGLNDVRIFGRNWLGYGSQNTAVRLTTKILDIPLRALPGLCSDIYLIGKKPRRGE